MACVAPSAVEWRESVEDYDDMYLLDELQRAWKLGVAYVGVPYGHIHHDWTNFRTAMLREARRRGLDLGAVPARLRI